MQRRRPPIPCRRRPTPSSRRRSASVYDLLIERIKLNCGDDRRRRSRRRRTGQLRIEEESKNVVSERKIELDQIALQLQSLTLTIHEIPSDGHCLYHAIADQLRRIGQLPSTGALVL